MSRDGRTPRDRGDDVASIESGYAADAAADARCARTWSRTAPRRSGGTPYHDRVPELIAEMARLPELAIDGEFVPQFDKLARRSRLRISREIGTASRCLPAAIFAFDLLEFEGKDRRSRPLLERKSLLNVVLADSKRIRYVEHVDDGLTLFAAAEEAGVEGIVAKKRNAACRRGRSGDWIKIKTRAGRPIV
jgi:bifunctional non-homologous end joining protein LigD